MSTSTPQEGTDMKRELDSRTTAHGERITLFWYSRRDVVEIEIADCETSVVRSEPVPASAALDAFRHPYLYLGSGHEATYELQSAA